MRHYVGVFCGSALAAAVVTGIIFPALGVGAPVWQNLTAWVIFGVLLWGTFWGFGHDET